MDQLSRIVVGYHGCEEEFARALLLGEVEISDWKPSRNSWDWLGHGIYYWEYSPARALRWARDRYASKGKKPAVIGALIHLGRCFDLLDESLASILAQSYQTLEKALADSGLPMPANSGRDWKKRERDCLVINDYLSVVERQGIIYDTVRGAFLEGEPAYPGAGFSKESHVQIAVRTISCILGIFRPQYHYD
jgi:hypothetical protein